MRYAIIGAGLAGLTAAREISSLDRSAEIEVFEAGERIGGKLFTVPFDSGPMDMGAEAFLARRTDAMDFFRALGLGESIVAPSGLSSTVYTGGRLKALPKGGMMGIPASSGPVRDLVSEETAARIDAEGNAPGIDWRIGGDRNLGQLVRERHGDEVADRIVSALLGGVYSCTADDLGVRATVPKLAQAFDELAEAGERVTFTAAVNRLQAAAEQVEGPVFGAFRGGYAELYETLAERSGASIYLDAFISGVNRDKSGAFTLKGGGQGAYDRLLMATPAPTTAVLLKQLAPAAAEQLKQVRLASSAVVGMKFDSAQGLPENSGVLVATDEPGVRAKAFTFSSKKWPHLGERGGALVRASFGRFGDEALVRADEDDLVDHALDDLRKITGFDGREAGPSEIYTQRWFGGLPRYDETHLATVTAVREGIADAAGLEATGAWAGGVGVPAVIADARAAAARLVG